MMIEEYLPLKLILRHVCVRPQRAAIRPFLPLRKVSRARPTFLANVVFFFFLHGHFRS